MTSSELVLINNVGMLAELLRAKGYDNIIDDGQGGIYLFSEKPIDIRHGTFYPMVDVPRESTYARAKPCGHGEEVSIGDIVYMTPDTALPSRPIDIDWLVKNNKTGAIIKRTNSYILSFMVNEHGAFDVSLIANTQEYRTRTIYKGAVFTIDQGNNDRRSAKRAEKG